MDLEEAVIANKKFRYEAFSLSVAGFASPSHSMMFSFDCQDLEPIAMNLYFTVVLRRMSDISRGCILIVKTTNLH